MLKLKLQYLAIWCKELNHWKNSDDGKDWKQEEKGMTDDEMIGWHHQLDGHKFEQAPGAGNGQGSLACCSPWGGRVRHNWATELNWCVFKDLEAKKLNLSVLKNDVSHGDGKSLVTFNTDNH